MLFQEICRHLSDQERAALEYLESIGWQIMTEALLEDCKKKDGTRFRTFSLSGRYDVMVGLKKVQGDPMPVVSEDLAVFEEAEAVSENVAATIAEEGEIIGDNFWMDRDRWIRMSRDGFFVLVTEEAVDDLKAAPADVQEDVKEKFLRFFKESDWPLQ
jgi:hypothetical protein